MTGRPDPDAEPKDGKSAQLLLLGVLVLGVVATGVLVLTSDPMWLRLGVLAALWAALTGAYLAAKFRKQVGEREDEAAELQSGYERELEREAASRREFELAAETEAHKRVQQEGRSDLAELRAELHALRENLERLTGGEVLVERFALRAQSTRMRSLSGEDQRRGIGGPVVDPAATQLLDRMDAGPPSQPGRARPPRPVVDSPAANTSAATASGYTRPAGPTSSGYSRPAGPSSSGYSRPAAASSSGYGRPVGPSASGYSQPVGSSTSGYGRPVAAPPSAGAAEPQPARPGGRREPTARTPRVGTATGRTPIRDTPTGRTPVPGRDPVTDSGRIPPGGMFDSGRTPRPDPDRNPVLDSGHNPMFDSGRTPRVGPGNPMVDSGRTPRVDPARNPVFDSGRRPPPHNPVLDSGAPVDIGGIPGRPAGGPPTGPGRTVPPAGQRRADTGGWPTPGEAARRRRATDPNPDHTPPPHDPRGAAPHDPRGAAPHDPERAAQAELPTRLSRPVAPPPGAAAFGPPSQQTPRRAADPAAGPLRYGAPPEHPAEVSGGGRRRAEDRPAWQPDPTPSPYPDPSGYPAPDAAGYDETRAAPDSGSGGAHTAGRSVTELLAAHASDESVRRHRRRAD